MADLSIYKASAGSGKTFQLTREYLNLIFNPQENFRSVLAVTFTNKATAEMRERILNELYVLSIAEKSEHAAILKDTYNLNDKELKNRAGFLLRQILHNYSRFQISTIDSFFQKILKAFTRETGLSSGFNVELNLKSILEISIEQFFENANNNKSTKEWLSDYAIQKIENGKSWDIQKDIFQFSMDAFNEVFFGFTEEQLEDFGKIENFKAFKKELSQTVTFFVAKMQSFGREAINQIQKHNLEVSDFSNGQTGVAGYLSKLATIKQDGIKEPGVRVLKANNSADGIEGWCTKTSKKQTEIQHCVNSGLSISLKQAIELIKTDFEFFNTAKTILKGLDVFAVVVEVFNQMNAYCREKNIFLLPMASPLLSKMIGNDDAPFIYEKTGEYIKYFMIDEFQDTSKIQWQNFSPLFLNGISQGYKSIVVGDVKQSIYRWRNGDWTLLNHKLANDFSTFNVEIQNLEYNWRSAPEVVNFNNWIFDGIAEQAVNYLLDKEAPAFITDDYFDIIQNIYKSASQKIPDKNKKLNGKTTVSFCKEGPDKEENIQWYLNKMMASIIELLDHGTEPKDIAILVRRWKEGSWVAKHLMEFIQKHPEKRDQLKFVSNDSVLLGSSTIILLLIALLEYLLDNKNIESKAAIIYFYFLQTVNPSEAARELMHIDFTNDSQFLSNLPEDFSGISEEIKKLPFPAMVSRLLNTFVYKNKAIKIDQQLPFIHTFQDLVLNYSKNNGSDISGFLTWWKEFGITTPINLSEDQNAIRIITIHKSKGLEYDAVIIPFANWGLDQLSKFIWCKNPNTSSKFSMLPIRYSSGLAKTAFKDNYWEEKTMALMDNLNLLYVAFTRAIKALYIFAPQPKKEGTYNTISDLIFNLFGTSNSIPGNWNSKDSTYTGGTLQSNDKTTTIQAVKPQTVLNPILNPDRNLKIRLSATEFYKDENDQLVPKINMGSIYHKIMERITLVNDIESAVNSMLTEGFISKNEAQLLIEKLNKVLLFPEVINWYNNTYKVLNESAILIEKGELKRPDRVMISNEKVIVVDYKFTKQKSNSHKLQVKEYMNYIEKIEKKPTIGFVWYVFDSLPEKV